MQIHRVLGDDLTEALKRARASHGEGALVLGHEALPDGGVAVSVTSAEHDRVDSDNSLAVVFRILTGFPPRHFIRLDPR